MRGGGLGAAVSWPKSPLANAWPRQPSSGHRDRRVATKTVRVATKTIAKPRRGVAARIAPTRDTAAARSRWTRRATAGTIGAPRARDEMDQSPASGVRPSLTIDWLLAGLSVWLICGFYIDLWAHNHGR